MATLPLPTVEATSATHPVTQAGLRSDGGKAVPDISIMGIKRAVPSGGPKPVEVTSVPETPVNGTTPVGGSPRPVLALGAEEGTDQEPRQGQLNDNNAILGPGDSGSPRRPDPEPVQDVGGPDGANVSGGAKRDSNLMDEKKKLRKGTDDDDDDNPPDAAASSLHGGDQRPGKRAKVADGAAQITHNIKERLGKVVEGNNGSGNKAGRPKKDKNSGGPVGRTERKTRSQGPVE